MQSNALLKVGNLPNVAAALAPVCLPLLQQLRAYGMGSHVSDNDPEVRRPPTPSNPKRNIPATRHCRQSTCLPPPLFSPPPR